MLICSWIVPPRYWWPSLVSGPVFFLKNVQGLSMTVTVALISHNLTKLGLLCLKITNSNVGEFDLQH